ncbi:MAG: orotidine 5'-phosphate decarboxylase, partial [Defluviitaleaceae bacterium]|nr:orotidine 5'-phosphate decarboxylase [Defluviitaleaceae bacterium]
MPINTNSPLTSIDTLIDKIAAMRNPSVAGLDPRLEYIPDALKAGFFAEYGNTPKAVAEIFLKFNK